MIQVFDVMDSNCTPQKMTQLSAGIDVYASSDIHGMVNEITKIPLGIKIHKEMREAFPHHYFMLNIRSSIAASGLMLANGTGIIDIDYPKEIQMLVYATKYIFLEKYTRVGQLIFTKNDNHLLGFQSDKLRTGGFGSTGSKE